MDTFDVSAASHLVSIKRGHSVLIPIEDLVATTEGCAGSQSGIVQRLTFPIDRVWIDTGAKFCEPQ